jgi:hypothetical protein
MPGQRSLWVPLLCATFVATLWLNQSMLRREWKAEQTELFSAQHTSRPLLRLLRYPFVFLYRRSGDEELYFFTASQILGKPYADLGPNRGDVPPAFRRPPLPADGRWHMPYLEVPLEYPPLVLPLVLVPRFLADTPNGYCQVFCALMGLLLVASAWLALQLVAAEERAHAAWFFVALLLAQGALAIQRLDAVVALLMAAALYALAQRRAWLFGLCLGLLAAAKLVPVLLVPGFVLIDRELWRSRSAPWQASLAFVAGLLPMVAAAPTAFSEMLAYHGARGLQVESALGTLYGAVRALAGHAEPTVLSYGSFNFTEPTATLLGKLCMPLSLCLLAGFALGVLRAARSKQPEASTIAAAFTCALCLLWLTGKVFSPQYLTWLLPVAVVVPWRKERMLVLAVLVVSQLYLRGYYGDVVDQRPVGILTMLVRQGLIAWLAWACWRRFTTAQGGLLPAASSGSLGAG